uniref:Uncharacterized protein n=1 Tax=Anguilla anguilla TaxID=7936 RepID=A0A0E9WSS4_ANGAN
MTTPEMDTHGYVGILIIFALLPVLANSMHTPPLPTHCPFHPFIHFVFYFSRAGLSC